ncbi:MAG TPA: putative LPS assembly protein LptD, partial [Niastella sp.]|nr:putative LPS assembly protein LptD [Niastella sp.]
ILLYGKTKTVYKEITLQAPRVEMDQQSSLVTAYNERDSIGDVISRAQLEQGESKFESDTIQFNFKTQKGLTKNTYTQQDEMYVQGEAIKKINPNTFFVRRGRFTTCNLDDPHFAFVSNKLKVINNKVAISGPTHPEFEGVPVPVYLPFGYFPLSRGRHSGFLPLQFTTNDEFGLGLEGIGYYKVLNDNFDVTVRGNVYSYGGWNANLTPTYRKRYRYNGGFNLSVQHTKFNFKGDPDYSLSKTFFVTWNHSVDPRARPGTSFSANVNAGSSKYNQYIPNQPNRNFQNQLSSSIAYSKTWVGKPYNLTLSANHNQNTQLRLINIILPDAGFTVNTLYPFQRKEAAGTPKWYEKLGIG